VTVFRRGDVYLARLNPTQGAEISGERPVVVVSRDAINRSSPIVVVVPVTGRENKATPYPSQVELQAGDGGLTKDSMALGEQIRAIHASRLTKQLGSLSPNSMVKLGAALKITLDL
jgi:mRNA interferase MazF